MKKAGAGRLKTPYLALLLMYAGFVAARYILTLITSAYPTVGIDEFLYYSLGRSIATEGTLLYRAQPANYNYFIYPLVLSPIYALFQPGADYYRLIQLWNALLMNLSVFPVFALGKAIYKDNRKALKTTAVMMILPDFLLSQYIFSEIIIYPLFFAMIYCVYQYLHVKTIKYPIWIGVLGAVLFFTKPGTIVTPAAALIAFTAGGIRRKDRKALLQTLAGIGSLGAGCLILWLIDRYALSYSGSLLAVYDEQLAMHFSVTFGSMTQIILMYPYYFILGCGLLPMLVCVNRVKDLSAENRRFAMLALVCAAVIMVGSALFIDGAEGTYVIYLRYLGMFAALTWLISEMPAERPERDLEKKELKLPTVLITAFIIAGTAVWGCFAGVIDYLGNHAQLTIAALAWEKAKGVLSIVIILAALAALGYFARKPTMKRAMRVSGIVYIVICLANTTAGYVIAGSNAIHSQVAAAREVQNRLGGEEYLYVYTNDKTVSDHGLDVYSRRNIAQLALYDFYNHLHENGGVYTPFVPDSNRGMNSDEAVADVNTLVLDYTAVPMIKFNEETTSGTFSSDNYFCTVRFEKGARIVDAVMANVKRFYLEPVTPCILAIYKPEWLEKPIQLRLEIESGIEQDMVMQTPAGTSTIHLQAGKCWYDIKFSEPYIGYNFRVVDAGIHIYQYEISSAE